TPRERHGPPFVVAEIDVGGRRLAYTTDWIFVGPGGRFVAPGVYFRSQGMDLTASDPNHKRDAGNGRWSVVFDDTARRLPDPAGQGVLLKQHGPDSSTVGAASRRGRCKAMPGPPAREDPRAARQGAWRCGEGLGGEEEGRGPVA